MSRRPTTEWGRRFPREPRSSRGFWKVGLVLILLLGVFFLGRALNFGKRIDVVDTDQEGGTLDTGGSPTQPIEEVLSGNVLSIPLNNPIVLDASSEQEADIAQDTTEVTIAEDALETTLSAIGDTHGSGVATSEWSGTAFRHVIVATLPDPPQGYFYEGWLIRSRPFDFLSTGHLIQHADDLKWYLVWESSEDRRDFRKIIVTLEPDDKDPAPNIHVLEGLY